MDRLELLDWVQDNHKSAEDAVLRVAPGTSVYEARVQTLAMWDDLIGALRAAPEPSGNGKPPMCYVMRNKFDHNHVHQFMEHTWELLLVPSPPETKEEQHG